MVVGWPWRPLAVFPWRQGIGRGVWRDCGCVCGGVLFWTKKSFTHQWLHQQTQSDLCVIGQLSWEMVAFVVPLVHAGWAVMLQSPCNMSLSNKQHLIGSPRPITKPDWLPYLCLDPLLVQLGGKAKRAETSRSHSWTQDCVSKLSKGQYCLK